jgi:hypothetical protein
LRPQIKQASPSTAFLLLLLPPRLLGKHNLISWSLLQAPWHKTRQDKTFTPIDALHVSHLSSILCLDFSLSIFPLSLFPSLFSPAQCLACYAFDDDDDALCLLLIHGDGGSLCLSIFLSKACLPCILSYYTSGIWWPFGFRSDTWLLSLLFIPFYLGFPCRIMFCILCPS